MKHQLNIGNTVIEITIRSDKGVYCWGEFICDLVYVGTFDTMTSNSWKIKDHPCGYQFESALAAAHFAVLDCLTGILKDSHEELLLRLSVTGLAERKSRDQAAMTLPVVETLWSQ